MVDDERQPAGGGDPGDEERSGPGEGGAAVDGEPALDAVEQEYRHRTARLLRGAEERRERLRTGYTEEEVRVITFRLGDAHYAIELASVGRIGRVPEITEVPRTPLFIAGITFLKGEIITVVDLLLVWGQPMGVQDARGLVVLEEGTRRVGLLTTDLPDVIRLPKSRLRPVPSTYGELSQILGGVFEEEGRLVSLLDGPRVLDRLERGVDGS